MTTSKFEWVSPDQTFRVEDPSGPRDQPVWLTLGVGHVENNVSDLLELEFANADELEAWAIGIKVRAEVVKSALLVGRRVQWPHQADHAFFHGVAVIEYADVDEDGVWMVSVKTESGQTVSDVVLEHLVFVDEEGGEA